MASVIEVVLNMVEKDFQSLNVIEIIDFIVSKDSLKVIVLDINVGNFIKENFEVLRKNLKVFSDIFFQIISERKI